MMLEEELPRSEGVQYASGEEWRSIINTPVAPARMKQQDRSRSDAQVWTCLVVKAKSHVVKKNIALEASMVGP